MKTFSLKIIASNKIFFDGEAQSVVLPVIDNGSEGFLANHENCIVPIDATLVCISAELPEEIDARRAEDAKLRAEEELRQKRSQLEYYHSQANLARAMERLKVKNRHKI